MAAVAGALAGVLVSFTLNRLFPLGGAQINLNFDQARLENVLERLGVDFARVVDNSIRDAFLQHAFTEIKIKTLAASRFFTDHCASCTPEQPRGDEAALNNAYSRIEEAYASFQIQLERDLLQTCPAIRTSSINKRLVAPQIKNEAFQPYPNDERLQHRNTYQKQHENLYIYLEKAKAYMKAFNTIVSLNLLIIARRCDLFPGIRRVVPQTIDQYRAHFTTMQTHFVNLQEFRVQAGVGGLFQSFANNESGSVHYDVWTLLKPEWHGKKAKGIHTAFHTKTGIEVSSDGSQDKIYDIVAVKMDYHFHGNHCTVRGELPPETLERTWEIIGRIPNMKDTYPNYTIGMQFLISERLEQRTHAFAEIDETYQEVNRMQEILQQFRGRYQQVVQ